MKLILCDTNREVLGNLSQVFADLPNVAFTFWDVRTTKADVYVSPANGIGQMDGGIDDVYRQMFPEAEQRVQAEIAKQPFGELLVGQALFVPVPERSVAIIAAPTMYRPRTPCASWNTLLAMRAAMLCAMQFTPSHPPEAALQVICPGLGTGSANTRPYVAARLMRQGYDEALCFHRNSTMPSRG